MFASRSACAESRSHAVAYYLGGVRPQRACRKLDGARVSARSLPVELSWSSRRRAPRHGCQPCLRGSRPSSRVPSAPSVPERVSPLRHTLDEDGPADGNVSRAGDGCGVCVCVCVCVCVYVCVCVCTKRRFDEARLAGAPRETCKTCHTPLASEVSRRPSRDSQDMPHAPRTYTPPMRR